jgi:thiol-disulfide isomerase/thioredoxin
MKILPTILTVVTLLTSLSVAQVAQASKAEKPARIAHGSEVSIADHVVPGKITVFDFTSEFCPPCRMMEPHLDKLHASRDDLAVVKVDINRPDVKGIDWKSPVAVQYGLRSIPHFKVFDKDGKLMAEGDEARELVVGWLEM